MVKQELVDVVDEQGWPLRVVTRKHAHRFGLMHRAVRVLVFNRRGEVFVQQRSKTKDVNPGLWEGSLAGHQRHGETPVHTAVREAREELGLRIPKRALRRLGTYLTRNAKDRLFYTLFSVKGVTKTPRLNRAEVQAGYWEPRELVTRHTRTHPHKYTPGFLIAWHLFSRRK
ncbi:NUDIX domain-containing protein [Candidatus Woesearchaeota archaeon]|nr:NUDIX domain-containing protein [Candidatus Woesearchaeota archaeon]